MARKGMKDLMLGLLARAQAAEKERDELRARLSGINQAYTEDHAHMEIENERLRLELEQVKAELVKLAIATQDRILP